MKKLLISIFSIILLLPIVWFLLPKQTVTSDKYSSLSEVAPLLIEEAAIPAVALAKVSQGKLTYINTFGLANVEKNTTATVESLFNIASISKPIMGVVLLRLVDQGKLELDADINDYLSFKVQNPKFPNEKITVRHLASHSAGIADFYDINTYTANADPKISLKQHLVSMLTPEGKQFDNGKYYLNQKPGQGRKYSNLGAALAGQLVEEVTGKTLAQYSKEQFFPLVGMNKSSWLLNDLDLQNVATPYEVTQCVPLFSVCANTEEMELNYLISKYFNPPKSYKSYSAYPHHGNLQYPDGGIRTSVTELSNFLVSLLTNKTSDGQSLLSSNMYKEMFSLQLEPSVSDSQRFFWRDKNGLTGHMGSDLGVFTAMYFDVASQSGVIVLMNRGYDGRSSKAALRFTELLFKQ